MAKECLAWYELPKERWKNEGRPYWERDSQKQKLYDAEQYAKYKIMDGCAGNEINKEFESLEEIKVFVDMFTKTKWFIERFNWRGKDKGEDCNVIIKDKPRGGGADAHRLSGTIRISLASRHMMVVLHELAHIIQPSGYGASHGRFFARAFLEMVECIIGKKSAKILKQEFKKERVKYLPKRKLSEATREKLRCSFKKNVLKQTEVMV